MISNSSPTQNDGSELWHTLGCPKHKLIVGMAFYGRTYTLGSPDNHGLHAPVKKWDTNGGKPGLFTNESGFMSYFEFCQEEETWTKEYDKIGECPFAYKANQWVGYEDSRSLEIKMDWLKKNKFGGAMIWALDLDDYRGVCGEKDVLFNTLVRGLEGYKVRIPPAHELTTTRKPNEWWSPPPSSTSTTRQRTTKTTTPTTTTTITSKPHKTTRYTEPTTASVPKKPPVESSSSTTTTLKPITNEDSETNSGNSQECSPNSSGQLLSSFKPHPTDPTLYLWCVNGKELVLSCPPETEWNNVEKQCVAKEIVRAAFGPKLGSSVDEAPFVDGLDEAPFFESARIGSRSETNERLKDNNLISEVVFVPSRQVNPFQGEEMPLENVIFPPGRPIEWF